MPPTRRSFFFFFNDTATTEIYTLSLHDALPIFRQGDGRLGLGQGDRASDRALGRPEAGDPGHRAGVRRVDLRRRVAVRGGICRVSDRSEEHTSELQSLTNLVSRPPLVTKKRAST